jgi:hypothetical protein
MAEATLHPPGHERETAESAELLRRYFGEEAAAAKIAYLLEHQYTPATLSFAGLKNGDAALAKVLREAARRAACSGYLAIVHIEESGSAEVPYESNSRRYRSYYSEERQVDDSDSFSVIEVSERRDYVGDWKTMEGRSAEFGNIPLEQGELLPQGALAEEKPDDVRVSEATGNEGASFERSYHRAVVVLWPEGREFNVLLQAGAEAAVAQLQRNVEGIVASLSNNNPIPEDVLSHLVAKAGAIVEKWETQSPYHFHQDGGNAPPRRGDFLRLLTQLGALKLARHFVETVVMERC